MDLTEAARRVAEQLSAKDSADVGVTVGVVPAGWLDVHVHSRNPVTWFHSGVNLHADGRVTLPPSDDGCTPIGTPATVAGTASDARTAASDAAATSRLCGYGRPKLSTVVSKATTGASCETAVCTSAEG